MITLAACQLGDRVDVEGLGECDLVGIHHYPKSVEVHLSHLLGRKNEPYSQHMSPMDWSPMSDWTNPHWMSHQEKYGPLEYLLNIDQYQMGSWIEDDTPCVLLSRGVSTPTSAVGAPLNNHTCPTCKNTRVNRSEKNCWLCGGKL
jgi:hypothetical protein